MNSLSKNSKRFVALMVKIIIVAGAFYFIYQQFREKQQLDWNRMLEITIQKQSFINVTAILTLTFLNRFLEILKWQNLVGLIHKISISESAQQVMGALPVALFTPNGIGEYAGKALFFKKSQTKKIIFLNLICNGIQMLLSTIFGILGLLYFNAKFNIISTEKVAIGFGILFAFIAIILFSKKITIKGYSLEKAIRKINEIPKNIHQKNTLLAIARYLVFSHQYYLLFLIFDINLPYLILMSAITSVYFIASALPTFQFLDFAVKGSLAVFFFALLGVDEWIVLFISTLMWFLNLVIPVVIGSFYVLNFKTNQQPQWS